MCIAVRVSTVGGSGDGDGVRMKRGGTFSIFMVIV